MARWIVLSVVTVILTGCATFSDDGGMTKVADLTTPSATLTGGQKPLLLRTDQDRRAAQVEVNKLLAHPLSSDAAVKVALLNSRTLQAQLNDLGLAEADLVQAGRLPNPVLGLERSIKGVHKEIMRTLSFNLIGLLAMPVRYEWQQGRFALAQIKAAQDVTAHAAETRRAWVEAVAAQQALRYHEQVKDAAEAGAELARRMVRAGNFSKLEQARQQVFVADALTQLAKAQHQAVAKGEQLTRRMGLWGSDLDYKLPERLPDLPRAPQAGDDAEREALTKRLDLQMAKDDAAQIAGSLGLTKVSGVIDTLHLKIIRTTEAPDPVKRGIELEFTLPIFDWGQATAGRAEATYMQAVNRAHGLAVDARSEVREAYHAYRTAFDIARHYRDEIIPLRKTIADENLLRYNGMLIGTWDLLADARANVMSVLGAIEAQREFWLAETELHVALTVGKPKPAVGAASSASAEAGAAKH